MRCFWILALLVATTGFMAGCNDSGSNTTPSNEGNETQGTTDQGSGTETTGNQTGDQASIPTPAAVVEAFLEAARTGNDQQVAMLLTPTARKEVARIGLNVAPPASDTARFEVVETRKANEQVAHVACRWIEQATPSSEPQVSEMAWALRLTEEGWRVGGMAMVPFEGEPPLLLNYEKPAEVIQQYKMLHEEIARRKTAVETEQKQKTLLR